MISIIFIIYKPKVELGRAESASRLAGLGYLLFIIPTFAKAIICQMLVGGLELFYPSPRV